MTLLAASALVACSQADTSSTSDTATSSDGKWASSEGTLVFGAVPDKAGSDASNKPLEDYIAKEMGMEVEYYPTTDYTALIAAAVAGKIDIMNSGALQYVMATNKGAKLEPVASTVTSEGETDPGYYSDAIVPADSSIKSLEEAKGKTVCFVDPNSTSGFLFGLYQLSQAGLDVESTETDANGNPKFKDFTAYFAGGHDKSEQAVASKQCDLGFAEDLVAEEGESKGEVTIINKEYVPGGPISISTQLPKDVQEQLTEVLHGASLEAVESSGVKLTEGFSSSFFGLQPKDTSYYSSIIDLCSTIPSAKCEN